MTSSTKTKIRLGKISYLNCLPYYFELDKNDYFDFQYFESYPQEINRAMRAGELDIAPVSSLEYLNHQDQYLILPDQSISSHNFSSSVLLFSKEELLLLQDKEIAVSRESLSSVALLKILFHYRYHIKASFVKKAAQPQEMLKTFSAGLVIGNEALFYTPKDFVYKYDLGELWWQWTEKPFCFALWVVSRQFAEENPAEVANFVTVLRERRIKNLGNIESLIKNSLNLSFLDKKFSKIFGYLFNLYYDLDESTLEGLNLFYKYAHELGLSPKPKPLEIFGTDAIVQE